MEQPNPLDKPTSLLTCLIALQGDLRKFFATRVQPDDVGDLMQEVCVQVLICMNPAEVRTPRGFIWMIAWRVMNRYWRRRRAEFLRRLQLQVIAPPFARGESESAGQDEHEIYVTHAEIGKIFDGLCPNERAVILLFTRGYSQREIADELKMTPDAVRGHLKRAIKHYRRAMPESRS